MLPGGSNSMKHSMKRRSFLTTLGTIPALAAVHLPSTASRAPRKVVVGTVMQQFWVAHPGLTTRLSELCAIIDSMQTESRQKYGRGIDLAILPECAVTGEARLKSPFRAIPVRGEFSDTFAPLGECRLRPPWDSTSVRIAGDPAEEVIERRERVLL